MTFCSRSRRGAFHPNRTSALAARWTTASAPSTTSAEPIAIRDEVELDELEALGGRVAPSRNSRRPVLRLSMPTTLVTVGEQRIDQVRADEAGGAGDHDVHQESTSVDVGALDASQTSDVPSGVGTRASTLHTPANARPTRDGPATDAVGYGRRRTFEYHVVTGMKVRP